MPPLSTAHFVTVLSVVEIYVDTGHPHLSGFLSQAFLGPHRALAKDLLLWAGSLFS